MSALPLGVLISDRSGRISFVNQKARLLLGDSLSNITGSSFFSLFSNPEGNLIEKYSMLAEVSGQSLSPLILRLRSDPHRSFSISLFSLQAPSELLVATLLTDCPAA
jgi:PAS domain-containing protein